MKLVKPEQGYGFISRPDMSDLFFHASECGMGFTKGKCDFKAGLKVSYCIKQGKRGPEACKVQILA